MHEITPLSGQSAGGTLITMEGFLLSDVTVRIDQSGTLTEPELLSRCGIGEVVELCNIYWNRFTNASRS